VSQSWAFPSLLFSSGYKYITKKGIAGLSNPSIGYARDKRVASFVSSRIQGRKVRVTECSASSGGLAGAKQSSKMIFSEYSEISGGDIQVHEMAQGSYFRLS
jgi:hypothetical protein